MAAQVSEFVSTIDRFPEEAMLVADLTATNEAFRALCEEHALATQVLQRTAVAGGPYDQTFYEYLEIIRELEHEIAAAIANEKRSLRRGCAGMQATNKSDASRP